MDQQQDLNHASDKVRFHVFRDERFVDLNLYQCGWEQCEPLHQFGPAMRNHFLFHYVISGKGRLQANEQIYHIRPGQGFLICPGQVTTYYADEQEPWHYAWIEFDGLRAKECMTLAGLSEQRPIYVPSERRNEQELERLLLRLVDQADTCSPIRMIGLGMIVLDEIIQSSKYHVQESERQLRDFYVKEAIAFVDLNYQRNISVEEIAMACGLNRSYFGRLFKEAMGESPQQFLIHYRMTKAADLLKASRIPIAQVGQSVGYENQLHFSRAFKSVYDISPSEFRRTHFLFGANHSS